MYGIVINDLFYCSNMRGMKAKQRKCSTNSHLYKMQVYNKSNPLRLIIFLLFPFTSIKLFTLPDKLQIEKKVQELERILSALQKNSVRAILFLCSFFVCFFINRSDRINTKALRCIVMPLKTRLVVGYHLLKPTMIHQEKKTKSAMFPLTIDKNFYVFKTS